MEEIKAIHLLWINKCFSGRMKFKKDNEVEIEKVNNNKWTFMVNDGTLYNYLLWTIYKKDNWPDQDYLNDQVYLYTDSKTSYRLTIDLMKELYKIFKFDKFTIEDCYKFLKKNGKKEDLSKTIKKIKEQQLTLKE